MKLGLFKKSETIEISKSKFKFRVYFSINDYSFMDTIYYSYNYKKESEALKIIKEEFHTNINDKIDIIKIVDITGVGESIR